MAKALIYEHKSLSFMSPVVRSIYPEPDDVPRSSNKMSLRPNDRNLSYRPPSTYESQYQMPHNH